MLRELVVMLSLHSSLAEDVTVEVGNIFQMLTNLSASQPPLCTLRVNFI
jgi:hypothetical protein